MGDGVYNVVVLGAGGVGKSALTARFVRDVYLEGYDPTIEEKYQREVVVDGRSTSLEVLDTAGSEQFMSLNELYIKSGLGFILVFSLAQESSLREVDNLRQQIYRIKGEELNIPIVVVGTKLDLTAEREVHRNAIQTLASQWGHPVYETSSKRNWHVTEVFEDLIRQMRERYPTPPRKKQKRSSRQCVVM